MVCSSKGLFQFAVCLSPTSFHLLPNTNLLLPLEQSLDYPCHDIFSVSSLAYIVSSSEKTLCCPFCPPSVSVQLKSRLLCETLYYPGIFGPVLALLVSIRTFDPFFFFWFCFIASSDLCIQILSPQ